MRILLAAAGLACAFGLPAQELLTPESVEAHFDTAWDESMNQDGAVPGAVVTVVENGRVLLNKGYGVSNSESGTPVNPEVSRLRIGSTSKLFTALTILALVDRGLLELDRDVNDYLDFVEVPNTYGEPVTIRTLLSHLSGFDAGIGGYMVEDHNDIGVDPDEFQRRLVRVRPPNREYGYDNMGLGLLGQIAAEVNGTTFEEAVEQYVAGPLGLSRTAMGVPDRQFEYLDACHSWDESGNTVQCTHKFMRAVYQGAGDISSTGADMSSFMAALLDGGCLEGRCLLRQETFAQFTDMDMNRLHPNGKGLGFILYEKEIAGRFAYGHDGGQDGFSTVMTLFPDHNVGVFISIFSYVGIPDDDSLSTWLDMFGRMPVVSTYGEANAAVESFAERFLAPPPASGPAGDWEPEDLAFLEGNYLGTRAVGSSLLTRMMRVGAATSVEVNGDEVSIAGNGPWRQAGQGVLRKEGEPYDYLYTRRNDDIFLQLSIAPPVDMLVKKPWHMNLRWTVLPLLIPILLAPLGLIYAAVQRKTALRARFGLLVGLSGIAVVLGIWMELEYFSSAYFAREGFLALVGWRLLLNAAWLAALYSLFLLLTRRQLLLEFGNARGVVVSLGVLLFALASAITVVLLPYWGLVGNFTGLTI